MGKYASSSYFWGGEWLEIGGHPGQKEEENDRTEIDKFQFCQNCQAPR